MATEEYKTVFAPGRGRYEEKKSVFLGACYPVKTEEEAIEKITAARKKYPDAKHHVYAYLLQAGNQTRYSDDREPSGSAGLPILDYLRKTGLTDLVCVVTRYFGGTLLGTGGLVRAYTAAAKAAVLNGGIAVGREATTFSLSLPYGEYERVAALLQAEKAEVIETDFSEKVQLTCRILQERITALSERLSEFSAGRLLPCVLRTETILFPLPEESLPG